jgi:outer membrane lipoprotein-sorting protein
MLREICVATFILSLAIPFGTAANSPAPAVQPSADEIVSKNVAAKGGLQAWRSVQAMSMKGKMDAGGNESSTIPMPGKKSGSEVPHTRPAEQVQLPFLMEMKRPHKSRLEIQFEGQTAIQVFDGTRGWKLRPYLGRKVVEPFTADETKSTLMESELDGPLVDCAAKGTKVEAEGTEKVEGHNAYKLKLTMKDGQVRHVWVDSETFLDVKIDGIPRRMDGRMRPVEVYMRDYRSVNGVMVPYLLETQVQGLQPSHKMQIETVVVNPKLDDSRFAQPNPEGK